MKGRARDHLESRLGVSAYHEQGASSLHCCQRRPIPNGVRQWRSPIPNGVALWPMAFVDVALLDSKMFLRQPLKASLSIQLLVFSSHSAWDGRQFSDVPAASASTAMPIGDQLKGT
jgi:hypothetical protein